MTALPSQSLLAFDASGWIHRYLHAGADFPAGALVALIKRTVAALAPRFVVVVFDAPGPTWRHREFPGYKANRKRDEATQRALTDAFADAREQLRELHAACVDAPGFEADDVFCTLSERCLDRGVPMIMVASDKDLRQLVRAEPAPIVMHDPHARDGKPGVIGVDEVRAEYGLDPWRLPDYFAIVGDASDGIAGVTGLGDKAARDVLVAFANLGDALDAVARGPDGWPLRERVRTLLVEHADAARLARRLVTLVGAPVTVTAAEMSAAKWRSE